jgi:glycosyltransferase involved in cell wall biosynthesis
MVMRDEMFPRVLVVGHTPFCRSTGTAITLSNLFDGWPKDRVAQIYTAATAPSTEVCEKFFYFSPRDIRYYSLRLLGWNGQSPTQGTRAIAALRSAADRRSAVAALYAQLSAAADLSPLRVSKDVRDWIRDYRPDLVYSMLGSDRLTRLAIRAALVGDVPLVPHFTDDWPETLHANGELLGLANGAVRANIRNVVRLAPLGMGISRPMAEEYERRYHIPFSVFANCVDDSAFVEAHAHTKVHSPPGVINLVYVGALHLDRWRSLQKIATALETITASGPPVRLTIYSPAEDLARHRNAFDGLRTVHLARSLTSQEVPGVLRDADILIHVESFTAEIRRYIRYSLSTKIPQYLAAGRPILGYGPSEVASMVHIRSAAAGIVVGVDDTAVLVDQLKDLCSDATLRDRLAGNGFAYATQHHRKAQVAARFAAVLREAADGRSPRPVRAVVGDTRTTGRFT